MGARYIAIALAVGAAGAATAAPAAGPTDADPPIRYTVRRGDNLYTLALRYLHHLSDYRAVQTLNGIGDPYRIPTGSTILVPRPLLKSDPLQGRVVAFRGGATIDGTAASLGSAIAEGGLIRTGPNAFVSIGLTDGSTITLPSQSVIRVERLRRFRLTGEMDRLFRLEEGRSQTEVTPRTNGRDRFEMRTPISVAAVRGTDFRIALLDGGKAATSEVLDGHVGLGAATGETLLDPGLGARVGENATNGPVKLLPPPALLQPERSQTGTSLQFRIEPLAGAVRYRVQVARDAGFLDIAEETAAERAEAVLPSLPDGAYFVRITAIDHYGLEGLPRVFPFERHLDTLGVSVQPLPNGRDYLFRWHEEGEGTRLYRFRLARAGPGDGAMIDEPGLAAHEFVARDLPPGDYVWRVQSAGTHDGKTDATWSPPQPLTVVARSGDRAASDRAKPPVP